MNPQTNLLSAVARLLIRLYQWCVSPFMVPRCRYLPTCSDYAQEALVEHGPVAGAWLALKRIGRCHPWGGSGFDPVPEARHGGESAASHAASHLNGGNS
jgi:hypothetical protein